MLLEFRSRGAPGKFPLIGAHVLGHLCFMMSKRPMPGLRTEWLVFLNGLEEGGCNPAPLDMQLAIDRMSAKIFGVLRNYSKNAPTSSARPGSTTVWLGDARAWPGCPIVGNTVALDDLKSNKLSILSS